MDRETVLIRARYNRAAKFYDWMDRMIKSDLRKKVLSHALGNVLEVGVGTGKNLEFYPLGCNVIGIDLNPGMFEKVHD